MRIQKGAVTYARDFKVDEQVAIPDSALPSLYPIVKVESCRIKGLIYRDEDDRLFADVDVMASLVCVDGRDLSKFGHRFASSGIYEILEKEDGEGEGFILPGAYLDTAELSECVLRFEIDPFIKKPD